MSGVKCFNKKKQKLLEKLKSKQRRSKVKANRLPVILKKMEELTDVFEFDEAMKWGRKGLKLYPKDVQMLEKVGVVSLEAGMTDQAYDCFCKAIEISPDNGASKYLYLGQLCSSEEAVGYILKGIDLLKGVCQGAESGTELSAAYCSLAEIYLTDECFSPEAEELCNEYCKQAVSCCPSNPEAYQLMASHLLSKDEKEEAKTVLLKGVALWLPNDDTESGFGSVDNRRGSADSGCGLQQASNQSSSSCIAVQSYESRINCAKLLMEVEEYQKACLVLNGLICEDDEVICVWYLLGWCHYLTKQHGKAKLHLTHGLKLSKKFDCDDADMLEHCQQLLEEIKDKTNDDISVE